MEYETKKTEADPPERTEVDPLAGARRPVTDPDQPMPLLVLRHPTNVIEALARVQAEIGGIPKMTQQQRIAAGMAVDTQGGVSWAYRGIDQIAQRAQPLFGEFGVVIVPTVVRHVVDDIIVKQNKWTDTTVEVRWDVYGPGGVDDKVEACTVGLGRDNSDKGYNKAMTGAYKNLLLRLLTVGDPQDDTDHESHHADQRRGPDPVQQLWERILQQGQADPEHAQALKDIAHHHELKLTEKSLADDESLLADIRDACDRWEADEELVAEPDGEAASDAVTGNGTGHTGDPEPDTGDPGSDDEAPGEAEAGGTPSDQKPPPEEPSTPTTPNSADTADVIVMNFDLLPSGLRPQAIREFSAHFGFDPDRVPSDRFPDAAAWLDERIEAEGGLGLASGSKGDE